MVFWLRFWWPCPQSLLDEEGKDWRQEESLMDPEVGATSSQLDGHESTHPGALEVW